MEKVAFSIAGLISLNNGYLHLYRRLDNEKLYLQFREVALKMGYQRTSWFSNRIRKLKEKILTPHVFLCYSEQPSRGRSYYPIEKVRDFLVRSYTNYVVKQCAFGDGKTTTEQIRDRAFEIIEAIDSVLAENKHNHSSTANNNTPQIELPLLCDSITEPSTQKGDDTLNYVDVVLKQPFQIPGMCGQGIFDVFSAGKKSYLKPNDIARALGYSQFNANSSLLATALKNAKISLCMLRNGDQLGIYLIDFDLVVPWLKAFAKETLIKTPNYYSASLRDDARMYAERMIAYLEAHPELIHGDNAIVSDKKEDSQMENITQPSAYDVTTITVQDFEDINTRAEAIVKFFGSSKKDALRAAITLKAQEVNRDLAPLIELLG